MSNNVMTDQKNLLDVLEKAVQERNELLSMIDRSNDMCALSDAYSYFYAHMNTAMKTTILRTPVHCIERLWNW